MPTTREQVSSLPEEGGWLDEGAIGETPDRGQFRAAAHAVLGMSAARQ